jgi:hypothetical protein
MSGTVSPAGPAGFALATRRTLLLLALAAAALRAHVGSPDVYFDGKAGAYPLSVTVRPPAVIPGVAEIEIRSHSKDVESVRITPTPLTGPGAKFAPASDPAKRSSEDPQFFTGTLWMMSSGSWQVKIHVEGRQGAGDLAVPVPNAATRTLAMDRTLGGILFALMAALAVGIVAIVGAAAREASLEPGVAPDDDRVRRGRVAMLAASALVLLGLWGGNSWWISEARAYDRYLYKPLAMNAAVDAASGKLTLTFGHTGWFQSDKFDDLAPDHGYLMHLFVVREPALDRVWHLHPKRKSDGVFEQPLPEMPAGQYRLFADIVHRSGFPETLVATLEVPPGVRANPLVGDDSGGGDFNPDTVFENAAGPFRARRLEPMRFHLRGKDGKPVEDLELYLGMPGHAAVLKKDKSVFAHLHPTGTVPMAALSLAGDPHAGHFMEPKLPSTVSFPYGFPSAGAYRVFVQLKRAGKIETAAFDVNVQ